MKPLSDPTPEWIFNLSRRDLLKLLPAAAVGLLLSTRTMAAETPPANEDAVTSEEAATMYNNYYEFGFRKSDPARVATAPAAPGAWVITLNGLVERPMEISLYEAEAEFGRQRFVRRMRCVEGWSMTIPWNGFPLGGLLRLARPKAEARYVVFTSLADPERMPEVRAKSFPFPYREGLRLDEALHPLTILALGAYDKDLLPQNGAPVRLVVPWKYGFKYIKAITEISLVAEQPRTTWNDYAPDEYGFYATVDPDQPHPRWPQNEETVFGPDGLKNPVRKPTLLFNGYDEVAGLYTGMRSKDWY